MVYLAYYCSHTRKQSVSFFFTICFTGGWFILDSVWRAVACCWHHPELKVNYWFIYLEVFCLWTTAANIWISIQYAQLLQNSLDNKAELFNIMTCESNFYNIVSAFELNGMLQSTFFALSILVMALKFHQVSSESKGDLCRV